MKKKTITDEQIYQLRDEAITAGDLVMAEICDYALLEEDGRSWYGSPWTPETARAECARVIADAEAQQD